MAGRIDVELSEAVDVTINGIVDLADYESEILEWVREGFGPGDVFTQGVLQQWAEDNGYTQEGTN